MRNNRLNAALVGVLFILGALFGLIYETSFTQKAFAAGPDVFYSAEEVSDMLQEEGDSLSQNPENNLLGDISDRNKWFYPHLSELYEKGLLDGAVSFKPDSPVEEEELVDLLAKVLLTKGINFEAVQMNEGGTLNRGRMASLLAQAAGVAGLETQEALFEVEKRIIKEDPQVLKDLRQVFDLGIITGYPDGSLHLDKRVSRGEMWAAASRLLRLVEKGSILPDGFVYLDEVIPDAVLEVRYYSNDNFTGGRVDGYIAPKVILTVEAAEALAGVADEFRQQGLILKIFDGYRPQQAVNNFVRWAADVGDTKMKAKYYPDVDKKDLFRLNFIAEKSSHSRGSTVDLTLLNAETGEELDMASGFDFFGEISHHNSGLISEHQLQNRNLLKGVMEKHGFIPYPEEWWHYTLDREPYPDTYFDFPVR